MRAVKPECSELSANVFGAISEAGRPLEVGWPQVASDGPELKICHAQPAQRSRPRMSRRTLGDAHMFRKTRCHKCVATCFSICASHSICMNVRLATTTKLQNSLKMKWGSWPSQHKHRCFLYLASNTIRCIGTFEKESGLTIRLLFQRYAKRLHSACYGADNEGPVRNILVIGLQSGPQDGNRSSQV